MARSFNGSSDVITTPNFNIPANPFTIAVWSFASSTSTTMDVIGAKQAAGNGGLQFRFDGSGNLSLVNAHVAVVGTSSTITLTANAWKLMAVTIDGSNNIVFYYGDAPNGLQSQSVSGAAVASNSHGYAIGAALGAGSDSVFTEFWASRLSDMAVWNVVLTSAEVKALAFGARPYRIRTSSLQSWWPLDGLQSPEPDLSGFANNGTLTGTALAAGPPTMMLTPRWPQFNTIVAGGGSAIKFRKTLSQIGGRVGTRQPIGWGI